MRAQIDQPRISRQPVDDERLGGSREQRLTAMAEISQPRRPVDRRTRVIALIAELYLARVHAYP